jgi:pimeloyl-ACP methyl ester carboxylesterase
VPHRDTPRATSSTGAGLPLHLLAEDTGPTLLVAHATGFHGRVYGPLAEALTPFRCLAPDLRGHGDAPPPQHGDYSWSGFAEDLLAIVATLERPLFGFGHSMGGAALLMAEQQRPGTFEALYIFEPIVFPAAAVPRGRGFDMSTRAARRRATFPSSAAALANFASKPPLDALDPRALVAYVDHGFAVNADGSVTLKLSGPDEGRIYAMSVQHDAYERLESVLCPVTVARGRLESGPPAMIAQSVVARLPRGSLQAFDDLGHFGPLERPEQVGREAAAALLAAHR